MKVENLVKIIDSDFYVGVPDEPQHIYQGEDLGRPTLTTLENKQNFIEYLKEK